MYNAISIGYEVSEGAVKSMFKGIEDRVQAAIMRKGKLSDQDLKGIGTRLSNILKRKLLKTKSVKGYRLSGEASLSLHESIRYDVADKKVTKYSKQFGSMEDTYSLNLNMNDYGYAIGAEEFRYTPTPENSVKWLKDKQARGVEWYVPVYDSNGEKTGEREPESDMDYKRIAYAMRKSIGDVNVALPNWYKLDDNESSAQIDSILVSMTNLKIKDVSYSISNNK